MAADGKFLYAQAEPIINGLYQKLSVWLAKVDHHSLFGIAGEYRRLCEIIEETVLVIGTENPDVVLTELINLELGFVETSTNVFTTQQEM